MNSGDFYVQAAAWSQIVASILFIAVLVWLWMKFIQPAIMTAQDNANKAIAEAERHRDEVKASLDVLRREIDNAKRDAEAIKERAAAQAEREHQSTVAETRDAGERAIASAKGEYDRALAAARERLRVELLEKALNRARDEATKRVDAPTNARLVDGFIASLTDGDRPQETATHG